MMVADAWGEDQGPQFSPNLLSEVANKFRGGSSEGLFNLRPRQGPVGGSPPSSTPAPA